MSKCERCGHGWSWELSDGRQEQEAAFKAVLIYLQRHHPNPLNMALIVEREATDLVVRAVEWPMRSD